MNRYGKGARNERELIHFFNQKGYEVVRAAGSGVNSLSPDILVFKRGQQYAFECKAWNNGRVAIEYDKFKVLRKWEENSGITTMIAWKIPRKGWYFMYLDEMEEKERSFSVTRSKAEKIGRKLDQMIR